MQYGLINWNYVFVNSALFGLKTKYVNDGEQNHDSSIVKEVDFFRMVRKRYPLLERDEKAETSAITFIDAQEYENWIYL